MVRLRTRLIETDYRVLDDELRVQVFVDMGKAGGERNVKGDDDKESICMK